MLLDGVRQLVEGGFERARQARCRAAPARGRGCSKQAVHGDPEDTARRVAEAARERRRGLADRDVSPWRISYPCTGQTRQRLPRRLEPGRETALDPGRSASPRGRPCALAGQPEPVAPSRRPHAASSMRLPSICMPPQMPSTGRRADDGRGRGRSRRATRGRRRRASSPGSTTRSARSRSLGARRPDDVRDLLERLQLVEVRGGRVADDRDRRAAGARRAAPRRRPRRAARVARHGSTPATGMPVSAASCGGAGASSAASPRNLFRTKPRSERRSSGRQQRPGAVQVGEGAAAVDVGDEQHRRAGACADAHVGEVGARRLISAGLPAPSSSTSSYSASSARSAASAARPERRRRGRATAARSAPGPAGRGRRPGCACRPPA